MSESHHYFTLDEFNKVIDEAGFTIKSSMKLLNTDDYFSEIREDMEFDFDESERAWIQIVLEKKESERGRLDEVCNIMLEWFGHSSFKIEVDETSLYFDPMPTNYSLGTTLDPSKEAKVSAIFVSHEHWDHFDAGCLLALSSNSAKIYCPKSVVSPLITRMGFAVSTEKDLQKLKERISQVQKGDIVKISDIQIKCLEASEGLSFLVLHNDKKVLFMGDSVATREMIEEKPDVVLFPVWAVKGVEAKLEEFLDLAKSSLCIPMHYHTTPDGFPPCYNDPLKFKELLGKNVNMKILEKNKPYQI